MDDEREYRDATEDCTGLVAEVRIVELTVDGDCLEIDTATMTM
jgi:hypothetical protein